jgi:hypothetical protein
MMLKMKNLKFLAMAFAVCILGLSIVLAVGENTYCAEKTKSGAWCQNVPLENVDQNYRYVPTSCDATSYCKLGTCVDSQEGTCMENSPQKVCENPGGDGSGGGVWFDKEVDEIPQCSLGCCLIGDEAAFVTQTRCKQLSSLYGLETNYRKDIKSEVQCIATATSQAKGACVFEKDFEKTCRFTTRGECGSLSESNSNGSSVGFHEDFLCSAEQLATNCGPSEKTSVVDGKDEVWFLDTCGNTANIYDANRQNDKSYWEKIVLKADSCGVASANGNAGSSTCGNCDYFLGSTGKKYDRAIDPVSPRFGDNICRDLGCEYKNQKYRHGETWCSTPSAEAKNLPGSRYSRLLCYNGEVTVEACSDFRQEVCIQDELNGFSTAACRVNMWQDCTSQGSQKSCENTDQRDCSWLNNRCVPKFAPGFDFWKAAESDAQTLCALGNANCIVKFEKGIFGDPECVENCECLGSGWAAEQNRVCVALGDCGAIENYLGHAGYYTLDDLVSAPQPVNTSSKGKSSGGLFG